MAETSKPGWTWHEGPVPCPKCHKGELIIGKSAEDGSPVVAVCGSCGTKVELVPGRGQCNCCKAIRDLERFAATFTCSPWSPAAKFYAGICSRIKKAKEKCTCSNR